MGFNSVYQNLVELFPQVDTRLLKAVAIEHVKDPDRAVESILTEVLPFTSEKSNVVTPNVKNSEKMTESPSPNTPILCTVAGVDTNDSNLLNDAGNVDGDSFASSFYDANDANDTDDLQYGLTRVKELMSFSRCEETIGDDNQAEKLGILAGSLAAEYSKDDCSQAVGDHEGECLLLSLDDEDKRTVLHAKYHEADVDLINHCNVTKDSIKDASSFENEIRVTDVGTANSKTALSILATHSSQICRIDLVEDIIEDAKNHKDALSSATEAVLKLIEDVEHKEKEAEQAKAAAARGGLIILEKVDEIKRMLKHAKEANEMHAGEVYGEKSILATEVRELHARLLGLADKKDKSLAMLDEMRKTLEARLATFEEERIIAEKEMLEKQEIARGSLVEQELIMEKVVQESKRLEQEASENAKLRDFLMEKGHVVDELEGEVSVICQDVKSLKEKFDSRVSLRQSLSIEQTSFRQASLSSSVKSHSSVSSGSSDPASGHLDLSVTPNMLRRALSSDCQTPRSNSGEETIGSRAMPRKELLDDDWELFEV